MGENTMADAAARSISGSNQARLLTAARAIGASARRAGPGIATHHRLKAQALQLTVLAAELGVDIVGEQARAVGRAIEARAYDAAADACEAFELAVEGDGMPGPEREHVRVPSPAAPAVKRHDVGDQTAPGAIGDDPVRDHAARPPGRIDSVAELGRVLRAARVSRGLSQRQVATTVGVGRRFVVELESGKTTSEIGRILAVCGAVGLLIVTVPA